jgi:hypothetical protein
MSFHSRKLFLSPIISGLKDAYFKYVTLLLHGNGPNLGTNNLYEDSSLNLFVIAKSGKLAQGSMSPYNNNWSNYFNGIGDYLTVPSNAAFNFASGTFTVECWFMTTKASVNQFIIGNYDGITTGWYLQAETNKFVAAFSGDVADIQGTTTIVPNVWYHVAIAGSAGSYKLFVNGVQEGSTYTGATSLAGGTLGIGAIVRSGFVGFNPVFGYISNARIINGTALYTSNFTPPTSPLTAVAGTSLLTCQSNRFVDNSSNNFAITTTGLPFVHQFSPFNPLSAYSITNNGGSVGFSLGNAGNASLYLNSVNTRFNFLSGTFTIEFWIYLNKNRTSQNTIISNLANATTGWSVGMDSSNRPIVKLNGSTAINITGTSVSAGSWHHIAVSGVSGSYKLFVDGNQQGSTYTGSTNLAGNSNVRIGADSNNSTVNPLEEAYISNLRITQTNVYTTNFSIPTYPIDTSGNGGASPSNIPSIGGSVTPLLMNFTNGKIFDNATKNDLENAGTSFIVSTPTKFGGGSIRTANASDVIYVRSPSGTHKFGTGDFTIDFWMYPITNNGTIIDFRQAAATEPRLTILITGGQLAALYNGASMFGASIVISTWTHVEFVRSSGNFYIFINGSLPIPAFAYSADFQDGSPTIGNSYNLSSVFSGFLDDIRITKGFARNTSNFLPPTTQYPDF